VPSCAAGLAISPRLHSEPAVTAPGHRRSKERIRHQELKVRACSRDAAGRLQKGKPVQKGQSSLFRGAVYALATAALLATQAPLSLLGAKRLSVAEFISVTELVLLLCVPFMLRTQRSREHFLALISSVSNLGKFGVLLLIGLIGIVLYAFGLGRGHPIVISAVLNLDPFWAAIIAYLVAGKKIPTSFLTFTLCLAAAFVGAMLLAISQADTPSLSLEIFDSGSLLAAGLALPVPVLWALSGSLVGKWFADIDESACIAVTFITAAAVVVPVTLAMAYAQSSLRITTDLLPAIALLAAGTILATGFGRVLYQKSLTVTDNNNGFVSIFFLLIPAFTCLLSLWMSRWISELKFTVGPLFFLGLGLIAAPILVFLWQSQQRSADPSSPKEQSFERSIPVSGPV
jgi:drug/metabolite transporter (DMT)-like permease